jgi:hypothetical protein
VYNDKETLDKFLLKGLKNQSVEYELILIDNRTGKFKSAPEALNYGGAKAKGDYLIFAHQDVELTSNQWLEDVENLIKTLDNVGIAGLAGVLEDEFRIKSNILNGIPPVPAGEEFKNPIKVQTLDECLVIIPKFIFFKYKFDEKLKGWHLYTVDYCLNIIKHGFSAYVLPMHAYHKSYMVQYPKEYFNLLKIILDKYKPYYEKINTTCGFWYPSYPVKLNWFLNTKIGGIFNKFTKK